jgi:hypothetical protein
MGERIEHAMFQASITVQVGNGSNALFWIYRWVDSDSIVSGSRLGRSRAREN